VNVSVDSLRAEQDNVIPIPQEFQHSILDRSKQQRLLHCELPESQGASVEHTITIFFSL